MEMIPAMKRFLAAILILLVGATLAHAKMVSVKHHRVNMRSGPGKNYAVLWELGKGYPLKVVQKKGNWIKVTDFEGDVGWLYKTLITSVPYLIVKKDRINIRSGPGNDYKIKGKANYGVVLRTLKIIKGWAQVKHEDGLQGWVKRDLVWGW